MLGERAGAAAASGDARSADGRDLGDGDREARHGEASLSVRTAFDEARGLERAETDAKLGLRTADADEEGLEIDGGSTTLETEHGAEDGEFGVHAKTLSFGLNGCPVKRVDSS
jgi:hypothetical protein